MNNLRKKPIIGLLGGIGSGKSTVAAEFDKLGCRTIDADKIAHELLNEPAVREKTIGLFGESILDSEDKIDRKKMAEIAFADPDKLSSLNSILHPLVLARTEQLIAHYKQQPHVKAIVLDMPLLAEVGWDKRCDMLIFVDCKAQLRMARMKKKAGFDENQLKIRENFQISLDSKDSISDNVVDNNSDLLALARQVADIFSYMMDNC